VLFGVLMLRIMHTPVGTMECSPQAQDEDGTSKDDQVNFTNRYVIHFRNARSQRGMRYAECKCTGSFLMIEICRCFRSCY
jgi:hypothetical protein